MKIALMTNNYKPFIGGVPISVERLAKALRRQGHQVTVFAPTYEEQSEEENVFRYATCMRRFIGGIVLPNPFDRRIEREFIQNHYDIIHVHHPMLIGRTAVYLSKKYHIPLVFTYHTRYEQYLSYVKPIRMLEAGAARENGRFSAVDKKVLDTIQYQLTPWYLNTFMKHCDLILTPTVGLQEYLHEICGISYERMAVLPTGLEDASFQATQAQMDAVRSRYQAQDRPLFLTVSRMSHEKNVEFLLKSIALLKTKYQKPFRFLMVGEGPDKQEYQQLCRTLGIEEEVVFTGKLSNEELPAYYGAADLFLFASKTETQGIVLLEAFAGSAPVYAIHATGVDDLVRDGYNGRLTDENTESYTNAVLDYLTGRDNNRTFSAQAYQTALQYRQEAVAQKAFSLYNVTYQRETRHHSGWHSQPSRMAVKKSFIA